MCGKEYGLFSRLLQLFQRFVILRTEADADCYLQAGLRIQRLLPSDILRWDSIYTTP